MVSARKLVMLPSLAEHPNVVACSSVVVLGPGEQLV